MTITIYHNNRCSKSREALAYLQQVGVTPTIVNYLETPPDAMLLKRLLSKLGISPRNLLRAKEDLFNELNLADPTLSDEQLIATMAKYPKLIERPIIEWADKALIARPLDKLIAALS